MNASLDDWLEQYFLKEYSWVRCLKGYSHGSGGVSKLLHLLLFSVNCKMTVFFKQPCPLIKQWHVITFVYLSSCASCMGGTNIFLRWKNSLKIFVWQLTANNVQCFFAVKTIELKQCSQAFVICTEVSNSCLKSNLSLTAITQELSKQFLLIYKALCLL